MYRSRRFVRLTACNAPLHHAFSTTAANESQRPERLREAAVRPTIISGTFLNAPLSPTRRPPMALPIALNSASHSPMPRCNARLSSHDAEELIEAGRTAELAGNRADARAHYEAALYRLTRSRRAVQAATLLRWIARTYTTDADFEAAMDCATAALAISQACGDSSGEGHAVNVQAVIHWRRGDLDGAESLLSEGSRRRANRRRRRARRNDLAEPRHHRRHSWRPRRSATPL